MALTTGSTDLNNRGDNIDRKSDYVILFDQHSRPAPACMKLGKGRSRRARIGEAGASDILSGHFARLSFLTGYYHCLNAKPN
jgi:hypothetical protein